MEDMTIGIINAIKDTNKTAREAIIDYLSSYTCTPKEHYSNSKLTTILRNAFIDYLKTAANPAFDVWQYFDEKERRKNYREVFPEQANKYAERDKQFDDYTEGIISALRLCKVMENGEYVNGFRYVESKHRAVKCSNMKTDENGEIVCLAHLAESRVLKCTHKDNQKVCIDYSTEET